MFTIYKICDTGGIKPKMKRKKSFIFFLYKYLVYFKYLIKKMQTLNKVPTENPLIIFW